MKKKVNSKDENIQNEYQTLTKGSRLFRNMIWNVFGQGLPLLVGLFAIPILIQNLGTERFGILTLAWATIGYFNLFDLGLGRALTKLVAEKLGTGATEEIPKLIRTSFALMSILGIIGALVLSGISNWLIYKLLIIQPSLQAETLKAFILLSICIPIVITTTGFRGVLEAHQRFGLVNAVRTPLGILTFLGPLVVSFYSVSLFYVVIVLVLVRIIMWFIYLFICLQLVPVIKSGFTLDLIMARRLIGFGGWMTVTNIVGPLMVYFDRFLIGAVISMGAVAYYATPYEVVTKLWIISGSIVAVLFPAFSTSMVKDKLHAAKLFVRGLSYIYMVQFPLVLVLVAFSYEGLELWLGAEFANNSSFILKCLAIGVFINSMAYVPSALIQGAGRPDLSAKTHIIELPLYLITLWWLAKNYGLEGVAIAWTVRITIDMVVFFLLSKRLVPETIKHYRRGAMILVASLLVLFAVWNINEFAVKTTFVAIILLVMTVRILYTGAIKNFKLA